MLHERLYRQEQYEYLDQALIEKRQVAYQKNIQNSAQRYIRLPNKIPISEDPFGDIQTQLKDTTHISNDLKQAFRRIRQQLIKELTIYNNLQSFIFQLPQSKFPAVKPGEQNMISYQRKVIYQQQDTFRDKLSPQQIEEISETGQFKVKSNREYITLPYVWKINQCIFKGKKNIRQSWNNTLECAFSIIYNCFNMFIRGIPQEVQNLRQIPIDLFSVIFGRKSLITLLSVDYNRQIAKQFWNQVMNKYYYKSREWGSDIWEYFYVDYRSDIFQQIQELKNNQKAQIRNQYQNERIKKSQKYNLQCNQNSQKRNKLQRVHQSFNIYWTKIKKKVFIEISDKYSGQKRSNELKQLQSELLIDQKKKASDQQILQLFDDRKFTIYLEYVQQNLPKQKVPYQVIQAIVCLLTIMNIFNKRFRLFQNQKTIQIEKIRSQVKQNHSILSLNQEYFDKQVKSLYYPLQKNITEQFYINLYRDANIQKRLNAKQKQVYEIWLSFTQNYDDRIKAKQKQLPFINGPQKTFDSYYHLLPPYQLVRTGTQLNPSFLLQRQRKMKVTNIHQKQLNNQVQSVDMLQYAVQHFKQSQFYGVFLIQIIIFDLFIEFKSLISTDSHFWKISLYCMRLKCWTINCFVFLLYCSWTGPFGFRCLFGIDQFSYDQYLLDYQTGRIGNQMRKPVLGVFSTVMDGISDSRRAFQALPDRGLFGKNLSRICNLIECYIFRFFIVGVIITLVLYPVAIILASLVCLVFILTIWIWVPIMLLITYLFNILVFQYQSNYRDQCVIKSIPLLSLLLRTLFIFLKMFFYTILFFVIAPLGAIIVMLFAIFQFLLRTFTDCIMLCLISTCGRTPSNNSAIATKISGPGMSRQYYMSINQQDVYILTQAQIQRIFMQKYNRIMLDRINEPILKLTQVMNAFMKPYNANFSYYDNNNLITKNVSVFQNLYSTNYQYYMARFPNRPYNVRFTREQLDIYLDNSSAIVKNFALKNKIENWIFQHFQILQDWDQLTRRIWMLVFQCGEQIFEPLQQIDQRFKLQDQYKYYDKKYGGSSLNQDSTNFKMKRNVNEVYNALQGEVQLQHKRASVLPFNHGLMNKQLQIQGLTRILNLNSTNSKSQTSFDKYSPVFLFTGHLNINQLIKYDIYSRKKAITNIEKNA